MLLSKNKISLDSQLDKGENANKIIIVLRNNN